MTRMDALHEIKQAVARQVLVSLRLWRRLRGYRIDFVLMGVMAVRSVRPRRVNLVGRSSTRRKRILVIRLDAMGDLIMATLIFRELKLRFPDSVVSAIIQPSNLELLDTNPSVDRILCPPPPKRSRLFPRLRQDLSIVQFYWEHLRNEFFDIALQPKLGPDYNGANLLLKLVDAPMSVKYEDVSLRGPSVKVSALAFRSMITVPNPEPRHEVVSNTAIVERLTGNQCTSIPELFLTDDDHTFSNGVLSAIQLDTCIVSVSIGAQSKRRQWPLERWAEMLSLLPAEKHIHVVVICTKSEESEARQLHELLAVDHSIICGASLRKVAAAIKKSNIFIGPDSGLAHLAAVVRCKALVISPHPADGDPEHENSPLRFRPFSGESRVIQPKAGIYPCTTACDAVSPHCILQITPDEVARICGEMLSCRR